MNASVTIFSNNPNGAEEQTRYLMSRIESLEKGLLDIHSSISSYVTKMAKTRDAADVLAENILNFSETERIDTSLRQGLNKFSNSLNAIQDFRDLEIKNIEEKVMNELSSFGDMTKRAKDELKYNSNARDKQILSTNRSETKNKELVRSNSFGELPNALTAYEVWAQRFEINKICELKRIFLELTKSELLFHSKSLEVLTKAYKDLLNIDTETDLKEFCTFFRFTHLGSPKRDDSLTFPNVDQINENNSMLRRFNSVPTFTSDENEISNDSKPIEIIGEQSIQSIQ